MRGIRHHLWRGPSIAIKLGRGVQPESPPARHQIKTRQQRPKWEVVGVRVDCPTMRGFFILFKDMLSSLFSFRKSITTGLAGAWLGARWALSPNRGTRELVVFRWFLQRMEADQRLQEEKTSSGNWYLPRKHQMFQRTIHVHAYIWSGDTLAIPSPSLHVVILSF